MLSCICTVVYNCDVIFAPEVIDLAISLYTTNPHPTKPISRSPMDLLEVHKKEIDGNPLVKILQSIFPWSQSATAANQLQRNVMFWSGPSSASVNSAQGMKLTVTDSICPRYDKIMPQGDRPVEVRVSKQQCAVRITPNFSCGNDSGVWEVGLSWILDKIRQVEEKCTQWYKITLTWL